ncbi:MAG: trimethylamine methyltransferase family protein, partial [Deltaproteobacteria bacterium]|nr:trimethylamine methyltransferase family protein [Deltaproteobacteria bacterium]
MQRFEILTRTQVEKVHATSLQILEEIGIEMGDQQAVVAFKKRGARIEGQRVFLPSRLVEAQIQKAPRRFTLHARNPQNNVVVGGGNILFAPGYGAAFVTDLVNGRRKATLKDFENFVKLTGASAYQDILSGTVVEPTDVPYETRHAHMIYTAVKHSDKCIMGNTMGARAARDSIQMAAIVAGGRSQIESAPAIIGLVGPLTPLKYDARMLGALMEYAAA